MIAKLITNFEIQKIIVIKFCNTNFTRVSLFWLNCDFAEGFQKGGGNFVGISHGGTDIFVTHRLLHCVRIAVGCELQGTVSVAEAMESDVLCDACRCNPVFQWLAGHAPFQTFEYFPGSTIAHKFDGFIA